MHLGKKRSRYTRHLFFGEGEDEKYEKVMEKFDNYFVPKVNAIHERARFHLHSEKPGETAEEYIRSLHELADTCDFGRAKDGNIRDRLVIGITDKKLSEKLQLMLDLTLIKAVELVRQYEQVKEHISEQASSGAQLN